MKMSAEKQNEAQHILIYGAPKTGKTVLAGSLAELGYKLWWFSLDSGHKALRHSLSPQALDNIELIRLPDTQLMPVSVPALIKVMKGGPVSICHEHGNVNCPQPQCKDPSAFTTVDLRTLDVKKDIVVIDHFAQLMDSVSNIIHKDAMRKDEFEIKSDWDDWHTHGAYSDRFALTIQNAPYNVVGITHEVAATMQDGTKKIAPVGGTRNQSSDFGKYWDHIVYTEIVGGKYVASCDAGDKSRVVIGSRTGKKLVADKNGRYSLEVLMK